MENYIPDIYQKSVYSINYDMLVKRGIKCILFDLDNTLVPPNTKEPNKKLQELVEELKPKIIPIIFSNSTEKRVKPFLEQLKIDGYYNVDKIFDKKIEQILINYNININELAIVGDQILTDIYLGNLSGITTILVNPISKNDSIKIKLNRVKEKKILKKLRDRDLFLVGRYYE